MSFAMLITKSETEQVVIESWHVKVKGVRDTERATQREVVFCFYISSIISQAIQGLSVFLIDEIYTSLIYLLFCKNHAMNMNAYKDMD